MCLTFVNGSPAEEQVEGRLADVERLFLSVAGQRHPRRSLEPAVDLPVSLSHLVTHDTSLEWG